MTTTPETARRSVPELEAAKLYRQIIKARRTLEEADRTAAVAAVDAASAKVNLETLEAEYRAAKLECVQ
jgi:hypothetical protein